MIDELSIVRNQFELRGYYYFVESKGKLYLHPQFDLIAWRPILLHRWIEDKDGNPVLEKMDKKKFGSKTNGWRESPDIKKNKKSFVFKRRYDGCP